MLVNIGKYILCRNELSVEENRGDASYGQKWAAAKMLSNIVNRLPPVNIGSCVLLPANKILLDRGLSDMKNVIYVVTDFKKDVSQIGITACRIKSRVKREHRKFFPDRRYHWEAIISMWSPADIHTMIF